MSKSARSSGYSTWKRKKRSRPPSATTQTNTHLRLQLVHNQKGYLEINLSGHNLSTIPLDLTDFTRLEVLNLSNNALTELPESLSRLRRLRILHLQENFLTQIPDTLTNCAHIKEINLTRNNLSGLPRSIAVLKALQVLKLGQNDFESLPHDIGLLSNLCYLDLHGNHIWYLPFSLHGLRKLKYLNLANNNFENLPLPVCQVVNLKILNLRGNNLTSLAPDFESLKALRELNLSYNQLDGIPTAVYKMKDLRYLNLAANLIRHVPHHITGLQNLQVLHLQCNKISNLPNSFKNLQYLNMANNRLYNVSIVGLSRLKYFNANSNFLENLPMGVYTLVRLENLRLNGNQIKYVSQDIAQLKHLKVLDLGNNKLTSFPQVIDQLHKLDYFNVKGNHIKHRISLMYGEIPPNQTDAYDNRQTYHANRRHQHTSRDRPRSQIRSSVSHPPTRNPSTYHKSHDLDELLQNGFSKRHIESNSEAVVWRANQQKKIPHSARASHVTSHVTHPKTFSPTLNAIQGTDLDTSQDLSSYQAASERQTDFRLLGICNQLEMLLNKQLLQPVLSIRGNPRGKSFSEKSIVPVADGMWRLTDENDNKLGIVFSRTESFSVTNAGGEFVSTVDPRVCVSIPRKSIPTNMLRVKLKIIQIEDDMLQSLRQTNNIIANLVAIGPVIFMKTDAVINFNSQITMVIPMPASDQKGFLHLLSIRGDNSCIPTSSGFQVKNGCLTLNAWQLSGKVAVMTKAKCKYKACSSVENLIKHVFQSPNID